MRYLSICSGIEAATVSWHSLGWQAAGFAEIEAFPSAVLAYRWPGVSNFGDFTHIEACYVGTIDLLVGGTPCQSFSIAGLREGLCDSRGNLALEYFALARRLRPRWLVWENVPGVLSSNGGRDFGSILGAMVECGYGFAYRVLDAQYFGVPQRRRRVFLVGYLGDWRPAAAVLFERQSLRWDFAPSRQARQNVAGTLGSRASAGGGGLGADFELGGGLRVSHTLNAKGGVGRLDAGSETFVSAVAYRTTGNAGAYATGDKVGTLGTQTDPSGHILAIPILEAGARTGTSTDDPRAGIGIGKDGDPMFTLQSSKQHAVSVSLRGRDGGATAELGGEIMPALSTGGGGGDKAHALTGSAVRRLTPRECERLQGFPDDYTAITVRGKPAADGPRYRAIGNSMAVPVMRWLGERIDLVESVLADLEPKRKRAA